MATTRQKTPWGVEGVSKATYYRKLKTGEPFRKEDYHKNFIPDWVAWRESGLSVRPWSNSHKALQLHYLKKYFDNFRTVSPNNLENWLAKIPAQSYSKRKHIHSAVSAFAKYLNHKGRITREDYLTIKALFPKRSPYHPPRQRIIYEEDLNKLIETASKGHHRYQRLLNCTLLIFLSETGLRVTEACNLTRQDLRFSTNPREAIITVRCGKGGKRRVVPFSKKAQTAMADYFTQAPGGERAFYSFGPKTNYQHLDRHAVARRFQAIAEKSGVDFSAHSLRHYRVSRWANNPKIPIATVQKWAGHSSLEMTQRYIHIRDDEALMAAYE